MSFEEEDQRIQDAFANMDEKIKQLKATIAFAELCMRKYRDAWALVQQHVANASRSHQTDQGPRIHREPRRHRQWSCGRS
jgi:hypothetical protein